MRHYIYITYIMTTVMAAITGCGSPGNSKTATFTPEKVHRLDSYAYRLGVMPDSTPETDKEAMTPGIAAIDSMLAYTGNPQASFASYCKSPAVKIFTPDVEHVYPNLDSLESTLGHITAVAGMKFSEIPRRTYFSIISPYSQSIFLSDSVALIALNHYLGADYIGYAGRFEPYRLRDKTPERLPYDIAEAIVASAYPYAPPTSQDATALSRMLYEGALLNAVMALVPDADTTEALSLTAEQLKWLNDNEGRIWNALIGNDLLYSTSPVDATRLVSPAPATAILGQSVPPRAGRFVGLRIIRSYLSQHPGQSMSSMLQPDFYCSPQTLIDAGYAPF